MAIQKTQNKLTRFLNNSKISDKISTKTLLKNINGLSVNQLNAQIKLTELWKSQKTKFSTINFIKSKNNQSDMCSRSMVSGKLTESRGSDALKSTFINDGIKAWNLAPDVIKNCNSLFSAKKEIKKFVKTLPI